MFCVSAAKEREQWSCYFFWPWWSVLQSVQIWRWYQKEILVSCCGLPAIWSKCVAFFFVNIHRPPVSLARNVFKSKCLNSSLLESSQNKNEVCCLPLRKCLETSEILLKFNDQYTLSRLQNIKGLFRVGYICWWVTTWEQTFINQKRGCPKKYPSCASWLNVQWYTLKRCFWKVAVNFSSPHLNRIPNRKTFKPFNLKLQ